MSAPESSRSRLTPLRLIAGVAVLAVIGAAAFVLKTGDVPFLAGMMTARNLPPADKAAPPAEKGTPAWSKQCVASPDGQKQACFVQQFVIAAPQNTVLLKVMFGYLGPDNKPRMIIEAPEGILIQSGLVLTVDTRQPMMVPLQACQPGACRAVVDMDDQALDQFRKGSVLSVRYLTGDHKAVDLPVKLDSLATALKQLTT